MVMEIMIENSFLPTQYYLNFGALDVLILEKNHLLHLILKSSDDCQSSFIWIPRNRDGEWNFKVTIVCNQCY